MMNLKKCICGLVALAVMPISSYAQNNNPLGLAVMDEEVSRAPKFTKEDLMDTECKIEDVLDVITTNGCQVIHYKDKTTKIYKNAKNWYHIKTPYIFNSYTGEMTNDIVDPSKYIGSLSYYVDVLEAQLVSPNGYIVKIKDGVHATFSPLGISYWYEIDDRAKKCQTVDFDMMRDKDFFYVPGKGETVMGPSGNILPNLSNNTYNAVCGSKKGGYYDETTNIMYYPMHDELYNDGLTMRAVSLSAGPNKKLTAAELKSSDVLLVYCLPSDKIAKVTDTDKTIVVNYANGDYLKLSKIRYGDVYDCIIHRPEGVWTMGLQDGKYLNSRFIFNSGPYKGLTYIDGIRHSAYGECLASPTFLSTIQMEDHACGLYLPRVMTKDNKEQHIMKDGNIYEKVEAQKAKEAAKQRAEYNQKAQVIYNKYCSKYGKSNVDAILKNRHIGVGMPFSVVKALCNYYLTDEISYVKWYRVWFSGYDYDFATSTIKPYDTTYFATVWDVGVVNGVVKFILSR